MPSLENDIIQALKKVNDWITRKDLATQLNKERLFPYYVEKLEELYQKGRITKRIQAGSRTTFEYKYLYSRRTRREIVYNVLKEYYGGEWITAHDIGSALGSKNGGLPRKDKLHLRSLVDGGYVESRHDDGDGLTQYRPQLQSN